MKKLLFSLPLLLGILFVGCTPNQTTTEPTVPRAEVNDTMVADETSAEGKGEMTDTMTASGRYVQYDETAARQAAAEGDAVLFFHAGWCPTCQAADRDIQSNLSDIPADLTIFKVDYDTSTELKQQYGVTYQHTFVQINENGDQVQKWNGGNLDEIIERI